MSATRDSSREISINASNAISSLFANKRFFLAFNIPNRNNFKQNLEAHSGIVVNLEKHADIILILDPRAPNIHGCQADTVSYKFVLDSITYGKLMNLEAYRVPSTGPLVIKARRMHTEFTLHDDQLIFDHFAELLQNDPYAQIGGHIPYVQFAQKHPQHPWQSWRTRYFKRIHGKPRPGGSLNPVRPPQRMSHVEVPAAPIIHSQKISGGTESRSDKINVRPAVAEPYLTNHVTKKLRVSTSSERSASISSISRHRPERKIEPLRDNNTEYTAQPTEDRNIVLTSNNSMSSHQSKFWEQFEKLGYKPQKPAEPISVDPSAYKVPFLRLGYRPWKPKQNEPDDITNWKNAKIDSGFKQETVMKVLRCTSMVIKRSEYVLANWGPNDTIPTDIPGCWTKEDDNDLTGVNARGVERVLAKHGEASVDIRWRFLNKETLKELQVSRTQK